MLNTRFEKREPLDPEYSDNFGQEDPTRKKKPEIEEIASDSLSPDQILMQKEEEGAETIGDQHEASEKEEVYTGEEHSDFGSDINNFNSGTVNENEPRSFVEKNVPEERHQRRGKIDHSYEVRYRESKQPKPKKPKGAESIRKDFEQDI